MADMNDTTCSSSSSLAEPDDISLLLRQILFRSSSSSSHFVPQNQYHPNHSVPFTGSDRVYAAESSSGLNSSSGVVFSSSGGYIPASGTNVSSSSVGTFDNDVDEYDCESEEGFENLGEEVLVKHVPRNSSKRSRAAEVHNLSEKRRRSRINEKMKALQNLIPNSNKTDKASMLDEAIEYLKQLQLQVQMLTMRNGISLYPMCLPGVVQPNQLSEMRMGFPETSGTGNMNLRGQLPMNQESPITAVFGLPNQCSNPNQPSLTNLTNIINSETSFGLESSVQDHLRAFQLHTSPEEICRGDFLLRQRLTADHSETNQLVLKEFHTGPKAKASDPFATRASNLKDNALEAGILGRGRPGGVLTNLECDQILSSQLNGLHTGRSFLNDIDDIKSKRLNF